MPRSALTALAALLDRSLVQIAEAAADGRTFDRSLIVRVSDVWDNNTLPLFAAATGRTGLRREQGARRALRWMAGFGDDRYVWMVEQSAAAGHPVAGLIPAPSARHRGPYRDYLGQVQPAFGPLTEAALADYDLTDCRILGLQVELVGERLEADLALTAPRRYDCGEPAWGEAELALALEAVGELEFTADSTTTTGALDLHVGPAGVELTLAGHGRLVAERADLGIADSHWHLSSAGRAADAVTPPPGKDRERPPPLFLRESGAARSAAVLLHRAMLEIRSARYASHASRRRVLALCRIFDGAGTELLAAARRGEAGFRSLVERWVERGGDAWARWFAEQLSTRSHHGRTERWVAGLVEESRARQAPAAEARRRPPEVAALRLLIVHFDGHRGHPGGPASAVVHLAVPPSPEDGGAWGLLTAEVNRFERLRLGPGAFTGPAPVGRGPGSLSLGTGFTVSRRSRESGQVGAAEPTIGP
ncbi:hypothetical protein [Kitasatospora sp. NPDC088351]|uniref:hypothetical protein n=1 Tax=Kitasatospora sp. NPDC088351 TaxID=3155180 RepID=UPI00343A5822